MILGQKIENAIKEAGLADEVVAGYVEISVATLRRLFKKDSADTGDLIKISEIVKKPLSYFLQELATQEAQKNNVQMGVGNAGGNIQDQKIMPQETAGTEGAHTDEETHKLLLELALCKNDREHLQKQIALKDKIISMLENKQE